MKGVLEEVGLLTINHCVMVRGQIIAKFIVDRSIFDPCQDVVRRRVTSNRRYWWEQPMDLDMARDLAGVADNNG